MKNFQESLDDIQDLTELVPLKDANQKIKDKAINSHRSPKQTRRSSSMQDYAENKPDETNQKQISFVQMQKLSAIGGGRLGDTVGSSSAANEMQVNRIQNLRKKKERLRTLMRARSTEHRQKFTRTVEFGHDFIVTYVKQAGTEVKEVLYNKNIQSFISYNDKQIHVWRKENGETVSAINLFEETGSHHISCVVYSQLHMLYLVISTDFKLHLFNEHLLHVGWLPLNIRLITRAYFHESKSTLITAGIDGVFMFKLNVKNKYDPKQGIMLDPEGTFFNAELGPKMKLQKMPFWVKGLKINENQNIIFSWSAEELCLNNLDGKILFKYKKLTDESDYITDVFLSERYRYFVTSTFHGSIIVWKFQTKKDIIHNFSNHIKCVTALQEIPNQPTLFLSASNDCTIRIYSLDKFQELYCFLLPAGVHGISLLNHEIFACYYQEQINIGELHHLVQNFYNSPIEVVKIGKIFENNEKKILNQPHRIMTLFSDNSIQIQKASKLDPQMVYTIFPPPGAKEVMFFGNCMNLDRIFVILVDDTICIYKFENSMAAILVKLIPKSEIKDEVSHGINSQNFTAATFCQTIPPKFDSEIYIGNDGSAAAQSQLEIEYQKQVELYPNNMTDRFLVLGLSKGTIIFLAVDRVERIYARLSFHSDAIQHIVEIPYYKKFISICSAYNICVWGFQDNRPNQLSYSQMLRKVDQISYMQVYPGLEQDEILNVIQDPKGKKEPDCMVLISFDFGDQQLFKYDEAVRDLVFLKTELTWEHDNHVEGVDVLNNEKKLFVSGGQDSYVKIWNMQKDLIREIRFPERIYSVIFLNSHGDLLVGHLGKVSVINRENYAPDSHLKRFQPERQALTNFFDRKSQLANTEVFFQIKKKVDELKKQAEAAGLLQSSKNIQQPKFIVNPLEQKQNSLETERKLEIIKKRKFENKRQSKIYFLTQKAIEQDGKILDEEMNRILQIVEESLQEEDGRSADSLENSSDSDSLQNSPKGDSKVTSPLKNAQSFKIQTSSFQTQALTSPKEVFENVSKQVYDTEPQQQKKVQIQIIDQNQILKPSKQLSRIQVAKLPTEKELSKRKTKAVMNTNSIISSTIPVNQHNLSIMSSNQKLIKESPKTIHQVSRSQAAFENKTNSITKSTQLIALSTQDDISMQKFIHEQRYRHDIQTNMISKMTDPAFCESIEQHIISTQRSHKKEQSLEDIYKSVHMVSAIPRKITEENYRQAVQMQIHRHVPYTRIGANLSMDQKRIPQGVGKQANSLTRRDYTFLRIQDNIEKFNDPRGIGINEAKFGLHMIAGSGRNNQEMAFQSQQKPGMQPLLALMSNTRQGDQYFDSAYSSMQSNKQKKLSNEGKVTSSSLMSVMNKNPIPAVPGIIGVAGLTGTLSMRSVSKKGKKDLNQAGLDIIRNNPNKTTEPQNQSHISQYNDQQSASDFSPIQNKPGQSHLNKILSIQKVGHDQSQNQQAVVTGPERRKIELKQADDTIKNSTAELFKKDTPPQQEQVQNKENQISQEISKGQENEDYKSTINVNKQISPKTQEISKNPINNIQIQEKTRNFELTDKNKSFQPISTRIYLEKSSFIKPNVLVQKKNQLFHIATTQVGTNKFGLVVGNNKLFSESETFLNSQREEEQENNQFFDSYGQSFGMNTQNTYRDSKSGFQESLQSEQKIKKTGNSLSRIQLNIFQKSHSDLDIRIEGSSRGSSVFDNKQVDEQVQKKQRYLMQKISESSESFNRKFSLDQIESKINVSEYGASVLPRGLTYDYQKLKAFELSAIHKKNGMSPQDLYLQYLTQKKPQKSQRSQIMQKSSSHAVLRQVKENNDEEGQISVDLSQQGVSIRFEKRPSDVKIASAKSKLISVLNDANKRHQSSMNQYKPSYTEDPFSNSISQEDQLLNFQLRLSSRENLPKQKQNNKILGNKQKKQDLIKNDLGAYEENKQKQLKRKTLSLKYSNIDPQMNYNNVVNQSVEFSSSQDSKVDLLASFIKYSQGQT